MKHFKPCYLSLLFTLLFGQKEYDIKSLRKIDGIFMVYGENKPAEGNVFKMIDNEKNNMGILKKGKKHGRWIEWHPDQQRLEENYINGFLDGSVSLFFKNGQRQWRYYYTMGILNGNYTRWYITGQKAIDGYFESGEEVGTWFWWNEEGQLMKTQDFKKKKNGMITGHNQYIDKIDIKNKGLGF